jgi:y4mF family transcriptional regulator
MTIPVKTPENLGKLVRAARRFQGLTQTELAGVSGTGVRFISDLENGKPSCHLGKVLRVLAMLGIAVTATPPGPSDG